MSAFENFIHFLQAGMDRPGNFGTFHICCLAVTLIASIVLAWRFHNASDKTIRRIIFIFWITLVVLEVYKQLVFSLSVSDNIATWDYQWYAFPFQFCSSPLYAMPFIIFLKDGKIRNAFISFFATFSFFAGFAVMLYPNDVFINMIGINLQTMIHHGTQVALGVLLVAHNRKRMNKRYFVGSLVVFYIFAAIAMILNEIVHNHLVQIGANDAFNMFYISPYHDCTLPVLANIYKMVPYPVFLIIYLIGFAVVSLIIFGLEKLFVRIICGKNK